MQTSIRFGLLLALCFTSTARPQESHFYVPETVSEEWQQHLATLRDPASISPFPAPDKLEVWKKIYEAIEAQLKTHADSLVQRYEATVMPRTLGGVNVLDIKPKNWQDNSKVLVYLHGGAYTLGSAHSTLGNCLPVADETGLRVITVDYTVAPLAKFEQVTDEAMAVLQALSEEGYRPQDIAVYGDSSGGGLAAAVVLKMRDKGFAIPAVVVLWSPWSDITETGDTYVTLRDAEANYIYEKHLKPCADAYADPEDQKNPYVSPVYGDYSKGFPPTLIQGGTKEIFLSNFIRQYQALDTAGQLVKLDLYEGMPHVFQAQLPDSRESKLALKKMRQFLYEHLD